MRVTRFFRPKHATVPPTDRQSGDRARDSGDRVTAAKFYRAHLDAAADDFDIWVQLAHCLKDSHQFEEALEAYGAAFELAPYDPDLLLSLGHLSKLMGDLPAAARYYVHSHSLDGNEHAQHEIDSSAMVPFISIARESLRIFPRAISPRELLGTGAADAIWHAVVDHCRRLVEQDPDNPASWEKLGQSLAVLKDQEEAEKALLRASELDPENAVLLLDLGHLFRLTGRYQEAANLYRRSYAIDRNTAARAELEDGRLADYLLEAEKLVTLAPPQLRSLGNPLRRLARIGSIDGHLDWRVSGWAIDPLTPSQPAVIGFFVEGQLVDILTVDRFRGDIEAADIGFAIAGFEADLDIDFSQGRPVEVHARLMSNGQELSGSPFVMHPPLAVGRWLARSHKLTGEALAITRKHMNGRVEGMTLSIVMPVYATKPAWLRESIASVLDQWCDNWELLCVDDCSPEQVTREIIAEFAARDERIKLIALDENGGISKAVNAGISAATGEYIGFLDHDDFLEPDAVFRMLDAAKTAGSDLIYSDEVTTSESIDRIGALAARPAFSHDYYLSHPYFVHFICARADIAKRVGYDETLPISADVDFVLRAIEQSDIVTHVPAVLYRWRTHKSSTGHSRQHQVTEVTLGILNAHLSRMGWDATASEGLHFNCHRIDFADDHGKVLMIIPTKDRHELVKMCLDSVLATTNPDEVDIVIINHDSTDPASLAYFDSVRDIATILPYSGPFNFAAMNNYAVERLHTDQPYVLFLNNDIEAIEPGWLEHMRGLARRGDVGIVGAGLLYPNRTYQHGGVVMGLGDLVDHAHKFRPFEKTDGSRHPGYNCSLVSVRDYSAITAACMMMRAELFTAIGGFDVDFAIGYNDTDICLRVGSLGLKILYDSYAVLYHHESATRHVTRQTTHPEDAKLLAARWAEMLIEGDPFYNPLLTPAPIGDHTLGSLNEWHYPARSRKVAPVVKPLTDALPEVIGTGLPRYL